MPAVCKPGLMPDDRRTGSDPCNGADFGVQAVDAGECVSPGPNLQILQLDHFYWHPCGSGSGLFILQ